MLYHVLAVKVEQQTRMILELCGGPLGAPGFVFVPSYLQ